MQRRAGIVRLDVVSTMALIGLSARRLLIADALIPDSIEYGNGHRMKRHVASRYQSISDMADIIPWADQSESHQRSYAIGNISIFARQGQMNIPDGHVTIL